jgi:hypothetical protein
LLIGREQPRAGVISKLTRIESATCTGLTPFSCRVVSEQVSAENQNHWLGLPIRCVEISFQRPPERR